MKAVVNRKTDMVLGSLYLRHLSIDPRRDREEIVKHCEGVLANKSATKYGDPTSFNINAIDQYLASGTFPSSYRASYKAEKITSWDKLILAANRFTKNFFADMEDVHQQNSQRYNDVIEKFAENYGLDEKKLHTKKGQKIFLEILETELALRIHWFIKFDEKHSPTAVSSLTKLTQPRKLNQLFLSLLTAEREDVYSFLKSKYRSSISSMYATLSRIPDMKKCERVINIIEDYALNTFKVNPEELVRTIMEGGHPEKLECFLEILKQCNDETLRIGQKLHVMELLHFINSKKGMPESYDELTTLLKDSKKSLNDFVLPEEPYMTIDQVRSLAFQKDISNKEIPAHNAKLFRTIGKSLSIVKGYLDLLRDLYPTQKNETNKDLMLMIYKDPDKVKTCTLFNEETKSSILEAVTLYHACKDTLAIINDHLVPPIANRFFKQSNASDPNLIKDLIQAGRIGLMIGIDRFKPELKFSLTTYANYWIQQQIRVELFTYFNQISHSKGMGEHLAKFEKMLSEQRTALTPSEIAKELNQNESTIKRYLRTKKVISLSELQIVHDGEKVGNDGEVVQDTIQNPSEIAEANDLEDNRRRLIQFLLEGLSEKERDIITLHFGLNGKALNLEETGKVLSLTRERVRQLESRILGKIRSKIIAHPELRETAIKLFFDDTNEEEVVTTNEVDRETALSILMEDLSERERYLITRQFRLDGGKKLSCPKIAMQLSMSEKGVYRMKFRALDKIKAKVLNHPELKQIADETFFNRVEPSEDTGEETGELNDNS